MKNKVKFKHLSLFLAAMMIFLAAPNIPKVLAESSSSYCDDIFISEYIEGGGNNKSIEIFNGTNHLVDLSNYSLQLYMNGSSSPSSSISLDGSLNPGDVYVISNTASDLPAILEKSNKLTGSINFNGNDAVELLNGTDSIDLIGEIGSKSNFAKDKTLVRNSSITSGNKNYSETEWTTYNKNDTNYLGSHTLDNFPVIPIKDASLKAAGETVTVIGTVTFKDGNNYYIQDKTGAIDIYKYGLSLNPGDLVIATGAIAIYKGLVEIKPSKVTDVTVLSSDNALPNPITMDISEITNADLCKLVKFENVTLGAINTSSNTEITDASGDKINIYKIPDLSSQGIKAGDAVDIVALVAIYNSFQLRVANASDVTISLATPDTEKPIIVHTPAASGNTAEDLSISATITDNRSVTTADLYYRTIGALTYNKISMTNEDSTYTAVIPKEDLTIDGIEYYIEATDSVNTVTAPEDTTSPYSVTILNVDITAPTVTDLQPSQGFVTGDDKKPTISASFNDEAGIDETSIKLYLDDIDITSNSTKTSSKITYIPATNLTDGSHIVKLEVSDNSPLKNKTTLEWNFTVGKVLYSTYFGMIHSHTNYSDGQGTPDDAYTMAKANADFFAVTDHSNSLDNDTAAALIDENGNEKDCFDISPEWKSLHEIADSYNEDGVFAAIAGYEMTWSGSTGGYGHINTYNTLGFETRNHSAETLQKYYDDISKLPNSISQLNHPGTTFGDFDDFAYRTDAIDNVVNLIEVGNGEGAVGSSGYFPSYDYYTRALDKGWHVAPTNNQDNHKGNWIIANEARTVILAPSISREELFKALQQKRVYSTEDKNLKINYTVNNQIMGSNLGEPSSLDFAINIDDPDSTDKISKVSIIVNGGEIAASKTFTSNQATWSFSLDPKYSYYYVRVDEEDKDIAVTAPVWVGDAISAGLSSLSSTSSVVEVNDNLTLSANLFNNGAADINNVLVEFFQNEVSESNKIGEKTIDSLKASTVSSADFEFTPTKAGTYTLYAKTTLNIDGKDKTFTDSIQIKALNPEDIIKVVIDAGHFNQYISGDYSNQDKKFKSMVLNSGYLVSENTDELTAADLDKAKLLILTDPQSTDSSSYSLFKSKYTESELNVIKEFVENGGSVLITSRADYKDATEPEYQSSHQGNSVLEALGSNLRFNDDEVVDNTENGGQSYRLAFNDFNPSLYKLTSNIPDGATYSFYSGCSVITKENADLTNVEFLVKGHETTETLDSDKQEDNIPVAMGSVNALALETIGTGKVIVAGSTFFSDFEISGDNINANLQITKNILNWTCAKEIPFSTIKDLKVDSDNDGILDNLGNKFTVEGYVTAGYGPEGSSIADNSFFDVLYIQDETSGITVFGLANREIPLGTKIRVTGTVDEYQGDAELQLSDENTDIEILDLPISLVSPTLLSTLDSMKEENEGILTKIIGTVTRIEDNCLYINDGSGEARVYLDGYIGDGSGNKDILGQWDSKIKIGSIVSAIGLASEDPLGHRLRVRNSSEIIYLSEDNSSDPGDDPGTVIDDPDDPEVGPGDETPGTTTKDTSNTEKDNLTTTGSPIDFSLLLFMGLMLLIAGAYIKVNRKEV
ncbi:MAG: CehA/McbA family metallohydrolase [Clostridiaceae bacterium]